MADFLPAHLDTHEELEQIIARFFPLDVSNGLTDEEQDTYNRAISYFADELVAAQITGLLNRGTKISKEIRQLRALLRILKSFDDAELDSSLIGAVATRIMLNSESEKGERAKQKNILEIIYRLSRTAPIYPVLKDSIELKIKEAVSARKEAGNVDLAAKLVAQNCKVIWTILAGEDAPNTLRSEDDSIIYDFVRSIFGVVFKEEESIPNFRHYYNMR